MSLLLTFAAPPAPMSGVPSLATLARIAEETDLDDGVRVGGRAVPARRGLVTSALADALHARYFRGQTAARQTGPGRRGDAFCRRLADALRPEFLRRDGWRFAYRTSAGVPSFVVAAGSTDPAATSCFLHLQPGTAPEVFARLVSALDGYGLGFRAELAGDPASCARTDTAVVTVDRGAASALARLALRVHERTPFALAPSVPRVHPPARAGHRPGRRARGGHDVRPAPLPAGRGRPRRGRAGREPAASAGPPSCRRSPHAGLDPAALHLNPGSREVDLRR